MSRTRSLSKLIGPSGSQAFDTNTLVIDAANNKVGIGTTAPSSLLTVAGTSDLAWSAATSKLQISRSGAVARLQNYENGSASTNLALQWEGGNVGIGTTTPAAKLDILSGSILLSSSNAGNLISNTGYINIGQHYSSGGPYMGYGVKGNTAVAGAYVSSTTIGVGRAAIDLGGTSGQGSFRVFTGPGQTTAVDSPADLTERMTITGDGRLQINNYTVSAGAAISAKSAISHAGAMVLASQNYATTFGVLPWSSGQTYLSSGTHYSDTTWKADGANAGASLLKFGGEQGLAVYFGDGTADERYDTYVSNKQVISKYGLVVNNKQSYNSGYGTGAELQTTSTSWQTLPWSGIGATGERISTHVLKFDKIDNNSDLIISIHMPWYTSTGSSGFGLRIRTSINAGSSYGVDWLTDGPAHGWGSGGYGSVPTSSIYNFTWNTEDLGVTPTYVGEVRVYFEVKVWAATDTFMFVSYPGYSKYGFVHIEEVSRNHA